MKSSASKMHSDGATRTSVGAAIAAMGLLALFAWATLPQAPLEALLGAESTLSTGTTAHLVHAETSLE